MTIPIVIVDRHMAHATGLFNPNAFPGHVKSEVSLCADRLAILSHSVQIVVNETALDRSRLLGEIRQNRAFDGYHPREDKPSVLILHNLAFVGGLNSALVAAKSLLDLYTRVLTRLLVPSANLFGFNKAPYKGRKLAGGRLLNWLEQSAPDSFEHRQELTSLLLRHIDLWIGEAVEYRDAVVHQGMVPGVTEAQVALAKALGQICESDVAPPRMSGGQPVSVCCEGLLTRMRQAVAETMVLLPEVDLSLLSVNTSG
jgi:hypothetical protein